MMKAHLLDGPLAGEMYDVADPAPVEIFVPAKMFGVHSNARVGFLRAVYRLIDEGSMASPAYRYLGP